MKVERFAGNPIIRPQMDTRMGDNVNGPSLIRVPGWVTQPLGRYYLYFAHHDGRYIRLAYAHELRGPWKTFKRGVLLVAGAAADGKGALFAGHVASPDVHVDEVRREIRLHYHGAELPSRPESGDQATRVAFSRDGLDFEALRPLLGRPYFPVFRWAGCWYALAMPGVLYRSRDGQTGFEQGPTLFTKDMRHSAVKLDGDTLSIFYTNVGDCPERILLSTIRLTSDWTAWRESTPLVVLEPEPDYKGGHLPLEPSVRGLARGPVRQLRDPAIFREHGRTYLIHAVAVEQGIAIAELQAD